MTGYFTLTVVTLTLLIGGGCRTRPDTPLTTAAARGDVPQVLTLSEQGADVNAAGGAGFTPLIIAARQGHIVLLSVLLQHGADPNRRGGGNDWTPLMHAIHKGQRESVLTLLEGGADINARTVCGTALMMAAGYGYTEIVQDLLAHDADPYIEDAHGDNALTVAVCGVPDIDRFTVGSCQTDTVKALLQHAPDLRLQDNSGGRLARWVAKVGHCSEVLRLLDQPKSRVSARHVPPTADLAQDLARHGGFPLLYRLEQRSAR